MRRAYAELRDRAMESWLPWDEAAERAAIGALLVGPRDVAAKLARRAWKEHFYLPNHGWLWARITYAITQKKVDFGNGGCGYWLARERIPRKYRERFQGSVVPLVSECLEAGFWWHGPWYIERVIRAAKLRGRIKRAVEELRDALDEARLP